MNLFSLSFFFFFLLPSSVGGVGLSVPMAWSGFMPMAVTSNAAAANMPAVRSAWVRVMADLSCEEKGQGHDTTTVAAAGKTLRERLLFPPRENILRRLAPVRPARLTRRPLPGNILPCWFPGSRRGRKRERGNRKIAAIRGCPRNCKRRASSKKATGKLGRPDEATTREPGDLPARSPNRWTGRPYGAVFRSGDVNAGAKAV